VFFDLVFVLFFQNMTQPSWFLDISSVIEPSDRHTRVYRGESPGPDRLAGAGGEP
jgi:hypothetical protein